MTRPVRDVRERGSVEEDEVGALARFQRAETVAQADILRAMGCDTVQGFIFSPPLFEEEFLAWSRTTRRGKKSVA